jgi:hypothetical protein
VAPTNSLVWRLRVGVTIADSNWFQRLGEFLKLWTVIAARSRSVPALAAVWKMTYTHNLALESDSIKNAVAPQASVKATR